MLLTFIYTLLALLAFAGNSVLCRLAIGSGAIDATSFTMVRLIAGALTLLLWLTITGYYRRNFTINSSNTNTSTGSWLAALMLFTYAATFSFAYMQMDTGVGALVLFGCVQITLMLASLYAGERFSVIKYLGLITAFAGLVYLLLPTEQSAFNLSITSFSLMALSGAAWGIYTLIGKGSNNPLQDTTYNFLKSLPLLVLLLFVFLFQPVSLSWHGVMLAIAAGALTSGLGYAIWYLVLPTLSYLQSGVVQLFVPVIAAFGGIIFVGETLTNKLLISLVIVLIGIILVIYKPINKSNE